MQLTEARERTREDSAFFSPRPCQALGSVKSDLERLETLQGGGVGISVSILQAAKVIY